MPIYDKRITDIYSIVIWESVEPIVFFEERANLSNEENEYYKKINNQSRKKEWLTVRYILQQELHICSPVSYDQYRKPAIPDYYLSISHSGDFVVVMISEKNCAVDIEKISNRVRKVAYKVFSEEEILNAPTDDYLTICWCVKEAVYKLLGCQGVDFKDDMSIQPFLNEQEGKVICDVKKPEYTVISLQYETIKNYKFVWTIDKAKK